MPTTQKQRGANYQRLTTGQVLSRDDVQEMLNYHQANTSGIGAYTLDDLINTGKYYTGNGAPQVRSPGWYRGIPDDERDALPRPNAIQVFDIAGDGYRTPEGGFGNGRGDAGYHYGLIVNPDGTFTVGAGDEAGLPSGDYSGSFSGQRADRQNTFNFGDFAVKAGLLGGLGLTAPALAGSFGGGALGGAAGGALGGGMGAIATDSDIGKGALFGGLAGGLTGFANGLDQAKIANSYGGLDAINSFDNGAMANVVNRVDGGLLNSLPSTGQLVKAAGGAGINMIAGQDPLSALTGSALNLTGITGTNALKDAGIDPKLAGVISGAGTGLLAGRDPTSIALGSLPAIGSYAGGLLDRPSNNTQQELSNSIEGGYASPMAGGDAPNTTGADNMPLNFPPIFGGGNALSNIFGTPNQSSGIDWTQGSSLDSNNGLGLNDIINAAISGGNNGYTDPFSSGSITGQQGLGGADLSTILSQLGMDSTGINTLNGSGLTGNWWDSANNPDINTGSVMAGTGAGITGGTAGTGATSTGTTTGGGAAAVGGGLGSLLSGLGGSLGGALGTAGLGALLGSLNGSKQSGTNVTTTEPWSAQQPYLKDLFSKAQAANNAQGSGMNALQSGAIAGAGGVNALQGQSNSVVGNFLNQDPAQAYGIGRTNNYQGQTVTPVTNSFLGATIAPAQAYQNNQVGTNSRLGMDNPYLQQSIDYANQDTERAMSGAINRANRQSGSFGNSGVAETYGRALTDQYGRNSNAARMADYSMQSQLSENDVNRRLQNSQYNTGALNQNSQFNAGLAQNDLGRNSSLASSLGFGNAGLAQNDLARNSGMSESAINRDVGQYNTTQSNQLNAAFNAPQMGGQYLQNLSNQFNLGTAQQNQPYDQLKNYQSLISGGYGNTSSSPVYTNPLNGLLGGAVAGSSIYKNLFGGS